MKRLVLALLAFAFAGAVHAQAYPSRAIRIVVPYAPGGTTDIVGRQVGQRMSEMLSQPVVIENRTGGNTAIGADAVAKAAPDGYTLLFTNDATFVLNPALFPSLTYNVQRDFLPVAAVNDVLGGQVLFTFPAFPTIQGHLKGGKLRVLAVSGDKRVPLAPDVPTFAEAGFKDMDMGAWYAFLALAGTPRDVVMKLNGTVNAILKDPAFVEKNMTSQGMVPLVMSPEQFTGLIKTETDRMAVMVKASGAKVE
jgi:tripartite-type tricarboxylate transporter receptor subunit TctC